MMPTWYVLPRSVRKVVIVGALATMVAVVVRPAFAEVAAPRCPGDCNGNGTTTIDELLTGVRIALGDVSVDLCSALDEKHDGHVDVADLVAAVQSALTGCVAPNPTPSPTATATPSPEVTAGIGLRTVRLTVVTLDGDPVNAFTARIDERGQRTSSRTVDIESGPTVTYTVKDPAAAIVILVSADGYYASVGVREPPSDPEHAGMSEPLPIQLVPKGRCIGISDNCVGQGAGTEFVPGHIIVGLSDWLWPDEVDVALEPYCQPVDVQGPGKTVSMWVDAVRGDPQAAVATLTASGLVQLADIRAYDGPVTGTSILVVFGPQVTINAGRDLVGSIDGLRWLRTVLSPTAATLEVPTGHEGEWVCQLKSDQNVTYASVDTINE